jgi:hypothetical protein
MAAEVSAAGSVGLAGSGFGRANGSRGGESPSAETPGGLTPAELARIGSLKARDQAVRGQIEGEAQRIGGQASFQLEIGPDGRSYATGGRVVGGDPDKRRTESAAPPLRGRLVDLSAD